VTYEQAQHLPFAELQDLIEHISQFQAQDDLRLLSIETYLHWSGPTSGKRTLAQKQGDKMRSEFMRALTQRANGRRRRARGSGDDVPMLHGAEQVRAFLGGFGINAAA
jgi:hypothetical protein